MLYSEDKKEMRRYRHILAAMIDESLGYFTPIHALQQIRRHKEGKPSYCEYYIHIGARFLPDGRKVVEDEDVIRVNREVIHRAFVNRHRRKKGIANCLRIVDENIGGKESLLASYF